MEAGTGAVITADSMAGLADMADAVFVVHAAAGSKIDALSLELLAAGKPLYTFDNPANAALLAAGAKPITPED